MKDQFVPYELAVKLKELGFDKECLAYYSGNNLIQAPVVMGKLFPVSKVNKYEHLAPLWQQAFGWLENEYNIYVNIDIYPTTNESKRTYFTLKSCGDITFQDSEKSYMSGWFNDKYNARVASLNMVIDLISI